MRMLEQIRGLLVDEAVGVFFLVGLSVKPGTAHQKRKRSDDPDQHRFARAAICPTQHLIDVVLRLHDNSQGPIRRSPSHKYKMPQRNNLFRGFASSKSRVSNAFRSDTPERVEIAQIIEC